MRELFLPMAVAVLTIMSLTAPAQAGMRCHVEGVVVNGIAYENRKCWQVPSEIIVRSQPHFYGGHGHRPRSYLAPRPIGRPVSMGHPVQIGRPVAIGR